MGWLCCCAMYWLRWAGGTRKRSTLRMERVAAASSSLWCWRAELSAASSAARKDFVVASLWVRTAVSEGIESMVARWPGKWAVSSVAMRICSWISCLQ